MRTSPSQMMMKNMKVCGREKREFCIFINLCKPCFVIDKKNFLGVLCWSCDTDRFDKFLFCSWINNWGLIYFLVTSDGYLTVNNITFEDAGLYQCQAVNSVGSRRLDMRLQIVGMLVKYVHNPTRILSIHVLEIFADFFDFTTGQGV